LRPKRPAKQGQQFRAHIAETRQTRVETPPDRHDIIAAAGDVFPAQAENFADQPACPVAPYGRADFAGHGQAQPPRQVLVLSLPHKEYERSREQTAAGVEAEREGLLPGQSVFAAEGQTVNCLRPLARRRRKISRPAAVRMRARKPCTRLRLIRLGLYVLFMMRLLK
jgi:hypothetical protein